MSPSSLLRMLVVAGLSVSATGCFDPAPLAEDPGTMAEAGSTGPGEAGASTAAEDPAECPTCDGGSSSSGMGVAGSSGPGGSSETGGAMTDGSDSSGEGSAGDETSSGGLEEGVCGDGVLNEGEACDDGNEEEFDLCNGECQENSCGHSVELFGAATCATNVSEFCVPPSSTPSEAACQACSGAPCVHEVHHNGQAWTSIHGRAYVAEPLTCMLFTVPHHFGPGDIKESDECLAAGTVVSP